MKQFNKIKEFVGTMSGGLKRGLLIGSGVLIIFAVGLAFSLNSGSKDSYITLFSGLNDQEASEVMAKLQEVGVDYHYQQDGRVTVPRELADKTRATLAVEGYPKSGFTYDTFLNNSNMMSTESDKKSLKIWEMQDRLAATIRLFDGVSSAVVQIAPGEVQKYVLDDSNVSVPTASVMVTMADGTSPTAKQVEGIQRLVSKAIANMDIGDVAVIDGNGIDVSVKRNDGESPASDEKMAFEEKVQLQVESKILNVLEGIYGRNNVRVSAKCTADMQKTITEENAYTAPNVEENSGYIQSQALSNESEGGTAAGGVPGAQTNANVPQYGTENGANQNSASSTSDTEYALNQRKVQSQIEGGTIADLSVAVSINSETLVINQPELMGLVARAAGIEAVDQDAKIMIVNSVWAKAELPVVPPIENRETWLDQALKNKYVPYIAGAVGLVCLILFIVIMILVKKSRKKAEAAMREDMSRPILPSPESFVDDHTRVNIPPIQVDEEFGKEMKDNIRGFAEENPEISAQLLKNWLRGGDENA